MTFKLNPAGLGYDLEAVTSADLLFLDIVSSIHLAIVVVMRTRIIAGHHWCRGKAANDIEKVPKSDQLPVDVWMRWHLLANLLCVMLLYGGIQMVGFVEYMFL